MDNKHSIKQAVLDKKRANLEKGKTSKLSWWQLSLIGIGSIIGAGFFLGTGLSIQIAGPAILLNYIIGGFTSFFVFSALAEMTVADPEPGSFRTYAKKAFGNSMGFVSGWMYWLSGVFIISSEAVALGTFAKYWFPNVPLWIFTVFFVIIAFAINLLGVKNFGKIESIFAIIKLSTLVIFILFGVLLITQIITPETNSVKGLNSIHPFLATGMKGMWSALIFVFFSFGGIEIIGIASSELKNREDIPKAGIGMLIALVAVYISSIFFVLMMVPWTKINASKSPFVSALSVFHFPYIDSFFNLIIISAALSTMVGSLFSVTNIMVSLAEDGEAPRRVANRDKRGTALKALFLTGVAVAISLILSFILPGKIYEYITTAAGVMMILNWTTILSSQIKLRKVRNNNDHFKMFGYPYTSYLGIILILAGVSGGLVHATQRMGVFISLGLILIIFISYFFIFKNRKNSYQN
ncbi:amino acid permease [Gottfriedia acidiceleris]|uniref:amino acid permease n=1 Tax=Gottfriedia acidiceleris TaxID=371036 RepID=UPI00101C3B2E|nr:amino acid permease [Gottfriedia acidiceleris]